MDLVSKETVEPSRQRIETQTFFIRRVGKGQIATVEDRETDGWNVTSPSWELETFCYSFCSVNPPTVVISLFSTRLSSNFRFLLRKKWSVLNLTHPWNKTISSLCFCDIFEISEWPQGSAIIFYRLWLQKKLKLD